MTLPNDKWEEIAPCEYQLRAYTPEQIERLSRRPTEWINSIVRASTFPPSERGVDK